MVYVLAAALALTTFAQSAEPDMGGATLTGVDDSETDEHAVPEVGAVSSPTPQPVDEPDLTVGSSAQLTGTWRARAMCESTLDPRAVSPNGIYFGLYQFDLPTWRSVGEVGNPINHSPAVQLAAAKRLQARRGWAPWPVCSRRLGLR